MFKIQLTPSAIVRMWCIYTLTDPMTNQIVYVGTAELNQLFRFSDVWTNAKFEPDKSYIVTIIDGAADKNDAARKQSDHLRSLIAVPYLNRFSLLSDKRPTVICDQTGERFKNAAQCAQQHGLGYPNLVNHLARKKGFNSVKGRTYTYERKVTVLPEPRNFDKTGL